MLNINTILNRAENKNRLIKESRGVFLADGYRLDEEVTVLLQVLVDEINKELAKIPQSSGKKF